MVYNIAVNLGTWYWNIDAILVLVEPVPIPKVDILCNVNDVHIPQLLSLQLFFDFWVQLKNLVEAHFIILDGIILCKIKLEV